MVVVTRAGRLREWSQGELRLYLGLLILLAILIARDVFKTVRIGLTYFLHTIYIITLHLLLATNGGENSFVSICSWWYSMAM